MKASRAMQGGKFSFSTPVGAAIAAALPALNHVRVFWMCGFLCFYPSGRLKVRKILGIAAIFIAFASPVQAQQGASGMIGETLLGASGYGQLNFNAALQGQSYASAGQFAFSPDPALRTAVTRNVLADIARNDQALADALGKNPFRSFGPALAAHNIRDTQLDDSLAFMMLALWDAANASSAETTQGQAEAVKRQARSILASMGGRPRGGSLQEASDDLYLSALMLSVLASKVMEGRDPSQVSQLQTMARRESMASFGVDFARMSLDDRGLMPR